MSAKCPIDSSRGSTVDGPPGVSATVVRTVRASSKRPAHRSVEPRWVSSSAVTSGCLSRSSPGTSRWSSSAVSAAFSARSGEPVSRAASASSSAQLSFAAAPTGAAANRSSAWCRWDRPRPTSPWDSSRAARTRSVAGPAALRSIPANNWSSSPERRPVKSCPIARSSMRASAVKPQSPEAAP